VGYVQKLAVDEPEWKVDHHRKVDFAVPFEGSLSITSMAKRSGWEDMGIEDLGSALFSEGNKRLRKIAKDGVLWEDIQTVFRCAVQELAGVPEWTETMDKTWPPLARAVTLRRKVSRDQLSQILDGEWRVHCVPENKPDDPDAAFSYGIVLSDFDKEALSFMGRSEAEGKYVINDGKVEMDDVRGFARLTYTEEWPNGIKDKVQAWLEMDGEFKCDMAGGYLSCARRVDTMGLSSKLRVKAKDDSEKFFRGDKDAAYRRDAFAAEQHAVAVAEVAEPSAPPAAPPAAALAAAGAQ